MLEDRIQVLGHELQTRQAATRNDFDAELDDDAGDDLLKAEFERAAALTQNERERALLFRRAQALTPPPPIR